jgi:beta-hydroxylase
MSVTMTLARNVGIGSAVVGAWLGSAAYVHLRGRERLRFMRQLADHSTLLAPYNTFIYLTSAIPNAPMLRREDFPELDLLRSEWRTIRDEAVALQASGAITKPRAHNDLAFNSFYKRDWQRFYLKWYCDYLPSARRLCPQTVALLERVPSVHAAMFAVLAPHSHLVRHRDPFAGSVRYHLGLVTPNSERCRIFVDGNPYVWHDGEDVVFDETFVHRAENQTDMHRIILFCDVERPLRSRAATALNRFAIRHVMCLTATSNVEGERVGAANRVFERLYAVRLAMKRLKKRTRTAYYLLSYGSKLAAAGGLLYVLLF